MTLKRNLFLAGVIVAASAGIARAEMTATAINDLNVRAGPGTQYPSVGVATRGSQTLLDGCVAALLFERIDKGVVDLVRHDQAGRGSATLTGREEGAVRCTFNSGL